MLYLLIAFLSVWLIGALIFIALCWNNKAAKGNRLELLTCSLFWPVLVLTSL